MEVNRLLSDELTYELQIRGYSVGVTVDEKRMVLRQAFREEREGKRVVPSTASFSAGDELRVCSSKLSYLENELDTFNFENRKNEFERLRSRLQHLVLRLNRIFPETENQQFQLETLVVKGRDLMKQLMSLSEGTSDRVQASSQGGIPVQHLSQAHTSILDTPNPLVPEVIHSRTILPPTSSENMNNCREDLLIPDLENQPAVVGRESLHFPQGEISHHEYSHPMQRPVMGAQQSSPSHREYFGPNSSHFLSAGFVNRTSHSKMPSSVRFAEDEQAWNTSENWSRMPNDRQFSRRDETFPSRESTSLADRLKDLHFSSVEPYGVPPERYRYMDLGRWNLKYDGISSVNNFLDRVEELRRSRGISKMQLLRSAAELFTKDALLWYRTTDFSSWDDLVGQLRDAFQPFDYENGIWEELRRRTQGAQERVVIFIASMEQLFNRLREKPSEESRIVVIRRNLLPYIQTQIALRTFSTIRELIQVCRAVEETEIRVQRFCPPPTNYRQLLEPELAYHKPSNAPPPSFSAISPETLGAVPTAIRSSTTTTSSQVSPSAAQRSGCWNCLTTGHRFKQCDKPRRLFCYRCGLQNVTATRCPKCSSKNSRRDRQ